MTVAGAFLVLVFSAMFCLSGSRAQATSAPVLLITNGGYGATLGEILRAEGLNLFDQVVLSAMNASLLAQYRVVILGPGSLTSSQAADLRAYVNGGGRLLAVCPDAQLADLFGLGASAGGAFGWVSENLWHGCLRRKHPWCRADYPDSANSRPDRSIRTRWRGQTGEPLFRCDGFHFLPGSGGKPGWQWQGGGLSV
ncbi:hypothetical protein [Anaerolinea thermolimosa]|uniref:hypothetical protein n=1 Tax=Anaerolinea thermolimosa TaxID=229919 RepID=UPI001F2B53FD|nr:hypothetical protein [Anaerolinea thermolimosa]